MKHKQAAPPPIHRTDKYPGSSPYPLYKLYKCGLIVHDDRPSMHTARCAKARKPEGMKTVIFKYPLVHGVNDVRLPAGARVLSVGAQGEQVVLWALVSAAEHPARSRTFRVAMTGEVFELPIERPQSNEFVGTCTTQQGFVFHVFELRAS